MVKRDCCVDADWRRCNAASASDGAPTSAIPDVVIDCRSALRVCTSMAARTASTTLRNSTTAPSPVRLTSRRPLRSAARLRRMGCDMLDAELLERPADLRRMAAVDLPRIRCLEVMAATVGVEAHRQAVPRENLFQRPEGRVRSLFLD